MSSIPGDLCQLASTSGSGHDYDNYMEPSAPSNESRTSFGCQSMWIYFAIRVICKKGRTNCSQQAVVIFIASIIQMELCYEC
jgi:hypothetical protein